VTKRDCFALEKLPSIKAWWDQVTLTPEESKIIVFISGTFHGLNASTPKGGHEHPNSTLGERLLWKKAQKKEKKNITSDVIKSIIPQRRPLSTISVCKP
jgi:hypothetical protein